MEFLKGPRQIDKNNAVDWKIQQLQGGRGRREYDCFGVCFI